MCLSNETCAGSLQSNRMDSCAKTITPHSGVKSRISVVTPIKYDRCAFRNNYNNKYVFTDLTVDIERSSKSPKFRGQLYDGTKYTTPDTTIRPDINRVVLPR